MQGADADLAVDFLSLFERHQSIGALEEERVSEFKQSAESARR